MNGPDIQKKILDNMRIVEEEAKKGIFTLSPRASEAIQENAYLRGICPHVYDETGHCIFCDKEVD
jgi:hypothetical protein